MTMSTNSASKRPKIFDGLVEELRQSIENGEMAPGVAIPSENELVRSHGLSRVSIRSALQVLEDDGLVVKKPGKGRFVRDLSMLVDEADSLPRPINIGLDIAFDMPWYGSRIAEGIRSSHTSSWGHRLVLVDPASYTTLRPDVVDGMIIGTVSEIQNCNRIANNLLSHEIVPVLFNRISEDEQVPYVSVNYRKESQTAVESLLREGHERIGIIVQPSPSTHDIVSMRYFGYCDAMGIRPNDKNADVFLVTNDDTATDEIAEFLKDRDITALFVSYGFIAPHVFRAAAQAGRKFPEDLKILCFDDISHLSNAVNGSFSYVRMPLKRMAQDAVDYIVRRVEQSRSGTTMQTPDVLKKLYLSTIEDSANADHKD